MSLLSAILIAVALGLMFVAFFPSIQENADSYSDLLTSDFAAVFADIPDGSIFNLGDYATYISLEYFSFFFAVVTVPFLIVWGTKAAAQSEKGTMALILSQPVSRTQVIVAQLLSILIKSSLLAIAVVLSVWIPAIGIEGADLDTENWLRLMGFFVLIHIALAYIASATSILLMSRIRAVWITTLIIAGGYLITVFTRLVELDLLDSLKYISVWYYMGDFAEYLRGEPLFDVGVIVYTVIVIGCALASWLSFKSKDMPNG